MGKRKESEIKTLKAFTSDTNEDNKLYLNPDNLRAEAVKWVKEDRVRKDNILLGLTKDELFAFLEDRWMQRLDIKEEDLK